MLKRTHLWGVYLLLAYMPFSLLISRWASLYTGGLGQWDAAKDIVTLILLIVSVYYAFTKKLMDNKLIKGIFVLSATYGIVHFLFFVLNNQLDNRSAIVATLYNGRVLAYLFIGYTATRIHGTKAILNATKIVLIASTITCVFAVIQYLAPKDMMAHLGYSIERGAKPAFFIDDKLDFPRVMSTIRDPNSFGAYLIVPITLIWLYLIDRKHRNKVLFAGLFLLHGLALFLTFSRGAWIGAVISLALSTSVIYREALFKVVKKSIPALLIAGALFIVFVVGFGDTYVFQNLVLHSDESTVMADPNELRLELQKTATEKILDNTMGYGPGTAGLVSIENPKSTFLTENYYLQIAYEIGVLGLIIFIAITVLAYWGVLKSKRTKPQAALIASFWAYAFIATLIHLWSNEAVAAQWWLLSGLAIGTGLAAQTNEE